MLLDRVYFLSAVVIYNVAVSVSHNSYNLHRLYIDKYTSSKCNVQYRI
jgi:hypothetical protein